MWFKSTNEIQHFYDFILLVAIVVFVFFLLVVSQIEMGFMLCVHAALFAAFIPENFTQRIRVDIMMMPQEMNFELNRNGKCVLFCTIFKKNQRRKIFPETTIISKY